MSKASKEFAASVLLADALAEISQEEFPHLTELFSEQDEELISSLPKIFKAKKLDMSDFLSIDSASRVLDTLEREWDSISFASFLKFDEAGAIALLLNLAGRKIDPASDERVAAFMKQHGLVIPKDDFAEDIEEVYRLAYQAAVALSGDKLRVTESRSLVMETFDEEKKKAKSETLRLLNQLQRRYYPKDSDLTRLIVYLEALR